MACVSVPKYTRVGSAPEWYSSPMDAALAPARAVSMHTGAHLMMIFRSSKTTNGAIR